MTAMHNGSGAGLTLYPDRRHRRAQGRLRLTALIVVGLISASGALLGQMRATAVEDDGAQVLRLATTDSPYAYLP